MKKFVTLFFRLLIAIGILGFVAYRVKFAPISVTSVDIQRGTVVSEVMGTGTLTAHTKATISPKIQGRIMELTVDQNDTVTTGQLLVKLDDSDLLEQVAIAKANLEVAQATLNRMLSDDASAQAVATQARLDYKRLSQLGTTGAVSTSDVDKSREALQIAEAGGGSATAAIAESRKQVVAAEKTLRYQEAKLSDTKIYSPFTGLVTRRDRDVGDIVAPSASIFQCISTKEIWASAWVDESVMTELRPEQKVRIAFRAEPQKNYLGKVVRVGREVDRETREFLVDISFDQLPQTWAIGQRAEVFIQTGEKDDVVRLPRKLLRWREGKAGVFVNMAGKAAWRELKLGMGSNEQVEVVSGLTAGDTVITAPEPISQRLQPGRRVVIVP